MTCLPCFRAALDNEQDYEFPTKGCQWFGPLFPGDPEHYRIGPAVHPEPRIRYMPQWSKREDFEPPNYVVCWPSKLDQVKAVLDVEWPPPPAPHKCRGGRYPLVPRWVGCEFYNFRWADRALVYRGSYDKAEMKRECLLPGCVAYGPNWWPSLDNCTEKTL